MEYYSTINNVFSQSGPKQWFEEKKLNIEHLPDYVSMLRKDTKLKNGDIIYVGGVCNSPLSSFIVHDF